MARWNAPGGRAWLCLLCLAAVLAAPLRAQPSGRIGRSQAARGTAFTDAAQTWNVSQTFGAPIIVEDDQGLTVRASPGSPPGTLIRNLTVETVNTTETTEMTLNVTGTAFLDLAADTSHGYTITVVGRATAGVNVGRMAMYTLRVGASNNGGTTAIEGDMYKEVICRGVMGWDANVSASDLDDRLVVTVAGDEASTVRWSATVVETIVSN